MGPESITYIAIATFRQTCLVRRSNNRECEPRGTVTLWLLRSQHRRECRVQSTECHLVLSDCNSFSQLFMYAIESYRIPFPFSQNKHMSMCLFVCAFRAAPSPSKIVLLFSTTCTTMLMVRACNMIIYCDVIDEFQLKCNRSVIVVVWNARVDFSIKSMGRQSQ